MKASGWLLAGGMAAVAGLRLLPRDYHRLQIAAEGTRDILLAPAPVLAVAAAIRRRPALALTFAALTADLVRHADLPRRAAAARASTGGDRCRIVTANLLRWNDRMPLLAAQIQREAPDIVVLEEFTPDHVAALEPTELWGRLAHRVLDPVDGYYGSGILSRWPIVGKGVLDLQGFPMPTADIQTPAGPVHVAAVHTVNPSQDGRLRTWRRQHEQLADHVRAHSGPLILAGDFNSTVHHRALRLLFAAGLRDAFTDAGTGWPPTWPSRRPPVPRVMRLDHVLFSAGIAARAATSVQTAGSDHRRVIADLIIEPTDRV